MVLRIVILNQQHQISKELTSTNSQSQLSKPLHNSHNMLKADPLVQTTNCQAFYFHINIWFTDKRLRRKEVCFCKNTPFQISTMSVMTEKIALIVQGYTAVFLALWTFLNTLGNSLLLLHCCTWFLMAGVLCNCGCDWEDYRSNLLPTGRLP